MTYQVTVSNLQGLVDAIANLSWSGLPGAVAQLTVVRRLLAESKRPEGVDVRDLVASVEGDGLSGRHCGGWHRCVFGEGYVRSMRARVINLFQGGMRPS